MPLLVVAIGVGILCLAHTAPFPFLLEWLGPGRSVWHQPEIGRRSDDLPDVRHGPNPAATPALLDVLAREDAIATFFRDS